MVRKEDVDRYWKAYPDLAVVGYINSTAEIKTWADVCDTSANAIKIVRALPSKNIPFTPDKSLGRFIGEQVPEKNIMVPDGFCPIHQYISAEELKALKAEHPQAKVQVHPECPAAVCGLADFIGSTSGIIKYAAEHNDTEFNRRAS